MPKEKKPFPWGRFCTIIANISMVTFALFMLIAFLPLGLVCVAAVVLFNVGMSKQKKQDAQNAVPQPVELTETQEASAKLKELRDDYDSLLLEYTDLQSKKEGAEKEVRSVQNEVNMAKLDLFTVQQEVTLQSFGLYEPHYDFASSDEYKEELADIRRRQKELIQSGEAVTGASDWAVNDSVQQGKRMVADMQKLLLRAYNAECDDAIEHVRFHNFAAYDKKITSSASAISKLGRIMDISITALYQSLKQEELRLAYEYQVKKQLEKEELRELRAKQREEAKAARELEEQRKKLEKEQAHYQNALSQIEAQIEKAESEDELETLRAKRDSLVDQLDEIDGSMKNVDYRAANQKAGYVYIISNIGAFGEGVYKIGMTRRLDPMDRVNELGDASVPFNFYFHAMIFTDDAPKLETALHNAFADKKVNFVNQRREFFRVSLDEIKKVVRENYDKTVEFVDIPAAEQYRESLLMQSQLGV